MSVFPKLNWQNRFRTRGNPSLRGDADEECGRGERRSGQCHDYGFVDAGGHRDLAQGGGGVLCPIIRGEGGGGEDPIGKAGSGAATIGEGPVGFVELNEDRTDRSSVKRIQPEGEFHKVFHAVMIGIRGRSGNHFVIEFRTVEMHRLPLGKRADSESQREGITDKGGIGFTGPRECRGLEAADTGLVKAGGRDMTAAVPSRGIVRLDMYRM